MIYIITILWIISFTDMKYLFSKMQFVQLLTFLKIDGTTTYYNRLEFFAKSKLKYEAMAEFPGIDKLRIYDYVNSNHDRIAKFCHNFATFRNRFKFVFGTDIQKRRLISEYGNNTIV